MQPLMRAWFEDFRSIDPGVSTQVEARGSSTAPAALVSGRAQIAAMSREMKFTELEVFRSRYGYDPTRFRVAVDAVTVFVHDSNSLDSLGLAQLDAIFSSTRACGAPEPVAVWADVGAVGEWASRAISACGRERSSGTRGFFRARALCGGHFRDDILEQPGDGSVIRWVSEGFCGIGYGGLSARDDNVKVLAISASADRSPVAPSEEAIYAGSYPLSRYLYVYVNRDPAQTLAPPLQAFLRYVLSDGGQARAREAGYLPLPAEVRETGLERLG